MDSYVIMTTIVRYEDEKYYFKKARFIFCKVSNKLGTFKYPINKL